MKHLKKKNEENLILLGEKDSRLIKSVKSENKIKKESLKKQKQN